MNVLEIIKNRRSIRKFTEQKISKEDIETILEAGRLAPSARNGQPWHFVVFDDSSAKAAFCKEAFSGLYARTMWAEKAPVLVAFVANEGGLGMRIGNMLKRTLFWVMDQGLAGQNMVLQAQSMGIGSCWIGWFDFKKAGSFLNTSSGEKVEILIAFGYPDENPEARPRKEFKEVVSYNKYK